MAIQTRICSICEAACSLEVELDSDRVVGVRANAQDTFSQGHSCAKGLALGELHQDPDRLRTPLAKNAQGQLVRCSWAEAFAKIDTALSDIRDRFGVEAIATYLGNPTAHNFGLSTGAGAFMSALGSPNIFSAGSVDQLPKQLASELMFGNGDAVPVPDIERTDLLVILGANPVVSNGSLWVVPGIRGKLRALRERGGRCVVVDPRRSETARLADDHLFIRPGTDAWLLAALCNQLLAIGSGSNLPAVGLEKLAAALQPFSLAEAAERTGIPAVAIAQLAKDLAAAPTAAIYGRVGTTLQRFGTLTSFLVEVANLLTQNLDSNGGAMFPQQAFAAPARDKAGLAYDRFRSRVSGYPEVLGQLPVACLAEEIETPGAGQLRGLVAVAGNLLVSNPDSDRLGRALGQLDFLLAIDIYHNETTAMADVVLPGTSPFEESHYDNFLGAMTYKNTARYSPPLLAPESGFSEWRVMLQLAHIAQGLGVADEGQLDAYEERLVCGAAAAYLAADTLDDDATQSLSADSIAVQTKAFVGADRLLELGVRFGPWGDRFTNNKGLTLQQMLEAPNSIEMGPLQPRLPQLVQHADGLLQLAPDVIIRDLTRLADTPAQVELLLIGRRNANTNNSWLHNLPMLSRGKDRAVLEMHPQDAEVRQIREGSNVCVRSSVGELQVQVEFTETLMPGSVSMPHGYSESDLSGLGVARAGANSNRLAPADFVDVPSATAALNGIPVAVSPV